MLNLTKRQRQIIDVCIELIAEKGIQNLTTKNISEKIGISEAAIYRHFNCKLDILLTLLDLFEDRFEETLGKVDASELNSLQKLEKFFLLRCKEFAINPNMSKVIFSEEIFQNEKVLSEKVCLIMKKHQLKIIEIVRRAQEAKEIRADIPEEHLTMFIMAPLRLLVTRWRLSDQAFDLVEESYKVWNSIKTIITTEV